MAPSADFGGEVATEGRREERCAVKEPQALKTSVTDRHRFGPGGHAWIKYSHKLLAGLNIKRYYYCCAEKDTLGCPAKKIVDRDAHAPRGDYSRDTVKADGRHCHPPSAGHHLGRRRGGGPATLRRLKRDWEAQAATAMSSAAATSPAAAASPAAAMSHAAAMSTAVGDPLAKRLKAEISVKDQSTGEGSAGATRDECALAAREGRICEAKSEAAMQHSMSEDAPHHQAQQQQQPCHQAQQQQQPHEQHQAQHHRQHQQQLTTVKQEQHQTPQTSVKPEQQVPLAAAAKEEQELANDLLMSWEFGDEDFGSLFEESGWGNEECLQPSPSLPLLACPSDASINLASTNSRAAFWDPATAQTLLNSPLPSSHQLLPEPGTPTGTPTITPAFATHARSPLGPGHSGAPSPPAPCPSLVPSPSSECAPRGSDSRGNHPDAPVAYHGLHSASLGLPAALEAVPQRGTEARRGESLQPSEGQEGSTQPQPQKPCPHLPPPLQHLPSSGSASPDQQMNSPQLAGPRVESAGLQGLLTARFGAQEPPGVQPLDPECVREALRRHNSAGAHVLSHPTAHSSCPPAQPQSQDSGSARGCNAKWSAQGSPVLKPRSCSSCASCTACPAGGAGAAQDLRTVARFREAAAALALCAQHPNVDAPGSDSLYSRSLESMANVALQVLSLLQSTMGPAGPVGAVKGLESACCTKVASGRSPLGSATHQRQSLRSSEASSGLSAQSSFVRGGLE